MINVEDFFPESFNHHYQEMVRHLPSFNLKDVFLSLQKLEENDVDEGELHRFAEISPGVLIGGGSNVGAFVVIESDVIIGRNVIIRPGALIRSGSIIMDHCVIGHNAEIKNAFIGIGSKVQGNTFVGDSILGTGVRIGTGAVIANRRFDQKEIAWMVDEEKILSGEDKLGAIIGDYVRLGANTITNPGITIGAYTWVSGGMTVSKTLSSKKFLKQNGEVVENKEGGILSGVDDNGRL